MAIVYARTRIHTMILRMRIPTPPTIRNARTHRETNGTNNTIIENINIWTRCRLPAAKAKRTNPRMKSVWCWDEKSCDLLATRVWIGTWMWFSPLCYDSRFDWANRVSVIVGIVGALALEGVSFSSVDGGQVGQPVRRYQGCHHSGFGSSFFYVVDRFSLR